MRMFFLSAVVALSLVPWSTRLASADDLATLLLWVEFGRQGEEAGAAIADYAEAKIALLARPNQIRAEIESCGDCADRARLEQELLQAEADVTALQGMEQAYAEFMGMDPATAYALGMPMRPDAVKSLPKPCIELYDMAVKCQFNTANTESDCEPHRRLFNYCQAGDVEGYNAYVEHLTRKARGDIVYEEVDNGFKRHLLYGQIPETYSVPMPDAESWRREYLVESENRTIDLLAGIYVYPMPLGGPMIFTADPIGNDDDTRARLFEDYRNLADPMILECRYAADYSYRSVSFWFGKWPGNFDSARYAAMSAKHPLLLVGPPISACPKWLAEAKALLPPSN